MSPSAMSFRRCFLACCLSLALTGCSAKTELRAVGMPASPLSIAEGRRLLDEGRAAEAVAAFRKLIRQEGDDLRALNGLAIAYSELGRPDLAAEMFSRALAMAPGDPATLNNIGFAALRRANVPLARHYLEKASGQKSDHQEIAGNLEGLAVLEEIDRGQNRTPDRLRQALHATPERSRAVHHVTLRTDVFETASLVSPTPTSTLAPTPAPNASPTAMIDFTAVIDPFSHR